MPTLAARFAAARALTGLSAAAFATRLGLTRAAVYLIEDGTTKTLKMETARKVNGVTGVSVDWLAAEIGPMLPDGIQSNAADVNMQLRQLRRIPVVGRAKGGDNGFMDEENYPVGHGNGDLYFPARDASAFGLLIEGDSMFPVFPHRSYACVEPNEVYEPGDDVYVALKDGRKLIKRLAWVRADSIRLDSYNPEHPSITIDSDQVEAIYPVTPVHRRHFKPS